MLALLGACPMQAIAAKPAPIPVDDLRDYALKRCLDSNYAKLGDIGKGARNDRSLLLLEYRMDNEVPGLRDGLIAFVEKTTADYFRAEVSMKDESHQGPYSRVFVQCMDFHRSAALRAFIEARR